MSFLSLIKAELKAILTNPVIVLTVIGGSILYSFLYPQPYLNQLPRKQKVILIDLDNTPLSRKLARMVSATPQVDLVKTGFSIQEIEKAIQKNEALGYLLIPKNFYKDIKRELSPTLVYGGNASFFLVYGTIAEAIFEASQKLDEQIKINQKLYDTKTLSQTTPSIKLNAKPVFNSTIGYINYVIPAVFILILHQIMLIGASIQGATQTEKGSGYWDRVGAFKLIVTRILVYLIVYLPISVYYMGFCFEHYSIPHLADMNILIFFMFTFIISATSLGIFLGEIIPRRKLATFFVLISSMPLVFTAGFVWPEHLITPWLHFLVQWVPVTPAILSMIKLNQMGADFMGIFDQWLQIFALGGFYLLLAFLIMRIKKNKSN
ncbi:MAG: ABC transporter [Proteobacteria bacterium]|nr:MAG: ABC transporter [Pseudomonadota bacterium]